MFKTKEEFNKFRREIEKDLQDLASKYGCSVHAGNIGHDTYELNVKVEFKKLTDASGKSVEQAEFETYCKMYGFTAEDYGKVYKDKKEREYKFVGFNISAPKYPLSLIEIKTGTRIKASSDFLKIDCKQK